VYYSGVLPFNPPFGSSNVEMEDQCPAFEDGQGEGPQVAMNPLPRPKTTTQQSDPLVTQ